MVIPEGHWFRPKPEELVNYLMEKKRDPAFTIPDIKDVNIYKYHPSELPGLFSLYQPDDQFCYFFCTLEYMHLNSDKFNRIAIGGSWKKTGKDHQVEATDSNKPIGIKKIFSFEDYDDGKENKNIYTMHEYHCNEQPGSKDQVVLCRIERKTKKKRKPSRIKRKPDKKRKPSSSLDKGQASDSLAYNSGNNVAQDISEVEPHLQPNQNTPYVTKNIFPEVRPLVPAVLDEIIDCNGVCHKSLSTFQSPIYPTPGSFYSSSFSNDSAHWLVQHSFSALQWPVHLPPESSYSGSFSNNLTNGLKLDRNSYTSLQWSIHPQPGSPYSSVFSNNSTNWLDHNSLSALQFQIHPPPESPYSSGFSNDATNELNHSYFSSLQWPIHPQPGSSHSSGFSSGSNVWTPQFASEQQDDLANLQLMEVKSQLQPNQHTSYVTTNICPELGSQLLPNQHISSNGEDHVAKYIHHQNPSNGLDHNSFSALWFPIHPPPEYPYSSGFSNDAANGLNHSSFSSLQSPIHPQPGSSHSSCISNGSIVWTPQSASEQEDDLANSRRMEVEPHLQPNQKIPYVTKNIFPEVRPPVPALQDELIDRFLNHSSFSAPQWPIYPQPGSSHSSGFSNGSNVWTPQSASEQEDDLANSRLMEVKSDLLQPNQLTSYVTTNDFPESESQLPPKQHKSSNGEDLVAKNISSENKSQPLPEPEDIFSGPEPLDSGKWDDIDGLQSPISSVFGDDSIVRNTLFGSELEDDFLNLEWELPDNFLGEETGN